MINNYTKENMTLEDIYEDKVNDGGIIEDILDEGYSKFEADEEYTLSTDEIVELYYDLIEMKIKKEKQKFFDTLGRK